VNTGKTKKDRKKRGQERKEERKGDRDRFHKRSLSPFLSLFFPQPSQIAAIAQGGGTITISQGAQTPGIATPGQQAVIGAVPPGSVTSIRPSGNLGTTVSITTPVGLRPTIAPYAPTAVVGALGNGITHR
jgi:hypothetical protein